MTFTNSLDPDQAQQNVGPDLELNCDLDPNCLTLMVFLKELFFEKVNFEKKSTDNKEACHLPSMQKLNATVE